VLKRITKVTSLEKGRIIAEKKDIKKRKKYVITFFYS